MCIYKLLQSTVTVISVITVSMTSFEMKRSCVNWYAFRNEARWDASRNDVKWLEQQVILSFNNNSKINLELLNQYAETHPLQQHSQEDELRLEQYFAYHLMRCESYSLSIEQMLLLWATEQYERNEWERESIKSADAFLRFSIRVLESIKINTQIRTINSTNNVFLKHRQQLRLQWQFQIIHHNNKQSVLQYDENIMQWRTMRGEHVEIDWFYYLQMELKDKQQCTFKYFHYLPLQNLPFQAPMIRLIKADQMQYIQPLLKIQYVFPESLHDAVQQEREELLDVFGESEFYIQLPDDLRILIESYL